MADKLLSREECEEILKAYSPKGFVLSDYEIVTATDAKGFLGEYYRLILHCYEYPLHYISEEINPTKFTFFVKSIPLKIAETQKTKIFLKESKLYATILKDLQPYSTIKWCPKSYYTRSDLFVLEDLTAKNFERCRHDLDSLTNNEVKAILNDLAALHASSIALEKLKGFKINEQYSEEILAEITISPDVSFITTGLRTIIELAKIHPLCQSRELQNFIDNELEQRLCSVYEMVNRSEKYRNVLCHRDPWRGNVLFNYTSSGVSAVLVDFQTSRYCPPSIDLLLVLFLNLQIESRKVCEKDFMLWYYKRLQFELSQHNLDAHVCLPYEELLCSYEEFKLLGYIYRAIVATLILVPSNLVTNDYKYVERTRPLLAAMAEDTILRDYIEVCIADLMHYIVGGKTLKNR